MAFLEAGYKVRRACWDKNLYVVGEYIGKMFFVLDQDGNFDYPERADDYEVVE